MLHHHRASDGEHEGCVAQHDAQHDAQHGAQHDAQHDAQQDCSASPTSSASTPSSAAQQAASRVGAVLGAVLGVSSRPPPAPPSWRRTGRRSGRVLSASARPSISRPLTAVHRPCARARVCVAGEWFHQQNEPLVQIGGHAINIVGYNDHFRTVRGFDGGWIVRNTWEDGMGRSHGMRARGSHSAAYFLQDVGELDESYVCPNPNRDRDPPACKCSSRRRPLSPQVRVPEPALSALLDDVWQCGRVHLPDDAHERREHTQGVPPQVCRRWLLPADGRV